MSFAATIVVLAVAAITMPLILPSPNPFSLRFLVHQDIWLAPIFAALACMPNLQTVHAPPLIQKALPERRLVLTVLALVFLLCWAGHYVVLSNYDLNFDERMVAFDAAVFQRGALVWPIPVEWRPFADALNRTLILPIGAGEAWVSAYLPVNAAFHAAAGVVADDDLVSPAMVFIGGLSLWLLSKRFWPDSLTARLSVIAFYLCSSQILVTGMTKFAMNSHLALNLLWLWLFLLDRRGGHLTAIVVGFLATGLHQPLFHPLFIFPFVGILVVQKRWRLLGFYAAAYSAIVAFWLSWPHWMASFGNGPVLPVERFPGVGYVDRLFAVVKFFDLQGAWLMSSNLIRFITWQHVLLLPFAIFGTIMGWRREPTVSALAIGFLLPIGVMWILLPWQGGGWGYRYLHQVLGNAILLAGWGVYFAGQKGLPVKRTLQWATAFSALVLVPIHFYMAYRETKPNAAQERLFASVDADILIADQSVRGDFVTNRPDLSNRPIRLIATHIEPSQMAILCDHRTVVFIDPAPPHETSPALLRLKDAARQIGCNTAQMREPWL